MVRSREETANHIIREDNANQGLSLGRDCNGDELSSLETLAHTSSKFEYLGLLIKLAGTFELDSN